MVRELDIAEILLRVKREATNVETTELAEQGEHAFPEKFLVTIRSMLLFLVCDE